MTTPDPKTLAQFLRDSEGDGEDGRRVTDAVLDIAAVTREIAQLLGRGALSGSLGSADTDNVQGETQKKLDVLSNDMLLDGLAGSGLWAAVASEEMEDARVTGEDGLLCLFDPLDGSSNIDVNAGVGTIFSVLRLPEGARPGNEAFLQPGTAQLAAGFALYGPSTVLVVTTGHGVNGFTLDPGCGEYRLTHPDMRIPPDTSEFTVNMANERHWAPATQRYIRECLAGRDGPRERDFNMRYIGSMVGDVYRVLMNGGVFLYPWDNRDPAKPGKLRLMYEANPMGFIVEQAGGAASTGLARILSLAPEGLHQRCPVVLGSKNEVERVVAYHEANAESA